MRKLRCWWHGCEPHPQDPAPPDQVTCMHCGEHVSYGDLVGDVICKRVHDWCRYWFFRKWWPKKCDECGRRWRACDMNIDHIPF